MLSIHLFLEKSNKNLYTFLKYLNIYYFLLFFINFKCFNQNINLERNNLFFIFLNYIYRFFRKKNLRGQPRAWPGPTGLGMGRAFWVGGPCCAGDLVALARHGPVWI